MNNIFIKFLRFVVLIPLCMLILGIVNWGLMWLFVWFIGLSKFWMIVVFIFFAGSIWNLFKLVATLLSMLTSYVSPNKSFGIITITVLSVLNSILIGYRVWTLKDDYSGWEIAGAVFFTILLVELTFALFYGASAAAED